MLEEHCFRDRVGLGLCYACFRLYVYCIVVVVVVVVEDI